MEVLRADIIMEVTWWQYFAFCLGVVGLVVFLLCINMREYMNAIIGVTMIAAGLIVFIFTPQRVPTGDWHTTVEITELEYYKQFVQEGYTFERVYDEREIYVLEGPEVEEGKG